MLSTQTKSSRRAKQIMKWNYFVVYHIVDTKYQYQEFETYDEAERYALALSLSTFYEICTIDGFAFLKIPDIIKQNKNLSTREQSYKLKDFLFDASDDAYRNNRG